MVENCCVPVLSANVALKSHFGKKRKETNRFLSIVFALKLSVSKRAHIN